MDKPLVSVVTTCRNAGNCIEKTIRSVLSQDFRDFEYLIMDGASSDDTVAIAETFRNDFAKAGIPYRVLCKSDHGIYEGMNNAVAEAAGVFLNFMNADDCFYDAHVLSDVFADPSAVSADVIYGDARTIEFGQTYRYVKDLTLIRTRMPFSHQTVFARRELLLKHPFHTDYRIGADYDFLLYAYDEKAVFHDCGRYVATVTLDGLSSLDLYHTFKETVAIQQSHGINRYNEKEYARKLRSYRVKQFVMDHFPRWFLALVRKLQRIMRGENEHT